MDSTFKINNKNAVIYARYSSDSQSEQSIEGQVRVINEYAKRNNIPIIDSYIDRAISGRREDRPEFQKMISDAKKKQFGYVLVYKYDRFSRDRLNSLVYKRELKKAGVKVISVTEYISDDPQGILFESIIDGYSEYYSAELAQKVKRGNRESRLKGLFTGGHVVYGYKIVDKKYVIVPEEAEIVKQIFDMASHGETYNNIAAYLNEKGIKHNGKEFNVSYLYKLTHNKKYIGIIETDGEVFNNIVPKIIDEDTYKRCNTQSSEKSRRGSHYKRRETYLLAGKIYCGYCGARIISESGTGCHGHINQYYKCSTKKVKRQPCECKTYKREVLEDIVISKIKTAILHSDKMEVITEYLCTAYNQTVSDNNLLAINEKETAKIQKEIEQVLDTIISGIRSDALKDRLAKLEEEKKRLEDEHLRLSIRNSYMLTPKQALEFLNKLINFDNNSIEYRKNLVNRLVNKVTLFNDKIIVSINDTDLNIPKDEKESNSMDEIPPIVNATDNTKIYAGYGSLILEILLEK